MEVADSFFVVFFASFFFCAVFLDTYGLGLGFWPPQQVVHILQQYCEILDPLFCSQKRWLQAMISIEAALYPGYCIAAIAAIRNGLEHTSDAFAAATVVFATMNVYSVAVILTEAFFGSSMYRPPVPSLYLALHLPFVFLPTSFATRVWAKRKPAGKVL